LQVVTKIIEYTRADNRFTIYPLGDIHDGVIHCDEDLLANTVSEIKRDSKALVIGMGDYGDLIVPSDFKRWDGRILAPWMKNHEDNIGPTQVDRLDEILSPIWNKFVCLGEGNHDEAIRKYHHYNFMAELLKRANKHKKGDFDYSSKSLDVQYGGVQAFIRLIFKRQNSTESHEFIIHARHGEGSARTSGARALAVLRLSQSMVNSHITLMGHLHGQESPDIPQRIVLRGGKIKSFESIATMTGAWIKAYMQDVPPCYLERWGTPPSTLGCPKIVIYPGTDRMELIKSRTTIAL